MARPGRQLPELLLHDGRQDEVAPLHGRHDSPRQPVQAGGVLGPRAGRHVVRGHEPAGGGRRGPGGARRPVDLLGGEAERDGGSPGVEVRRHVRVQLRIQNSWRTPTSGTGTSSSRGGTADQAGSQPRDPRGSPGPGAPRSPAPRRVRAPRAPPRDPPPARRRRAGLREAAAATVEGSSRGARRARSSTTAGRPSAASAVAPRDARTRPHARAGTRGEAGLEAPGEDGHLGQVHRHRPR